MIDLHKLTFSINDSLSDLQRLHAYYIIHKAQDLYGPLFQPVVYLVHGTLHINWPGIVRRLGISIGNCGTLGLIYSGHGFHYEYRNVKMFGLKHLQFFANFTDSHAYYR